MFIVYLLIVCPIMQECMIINSTGKITFHVHAIFLTFKLFLIFVLNLKLTENSLNFLSFGKNDIFENKI